MPWCVSNPCEPCQQRKLIPLSSTLEQAIQPFFKAVGQKVKGTLLCPDWRVVAATLGTFVTLLLDGDSWTPSEKLIASLVGVASDSAASRLVMPLPKSEA